MHDRPVSIPPRVAPVSGRTATAGPSWAVVAPNFVDGTPIADVLAADGVVLTPDEASYLTYALLRLAELGALTAVDVNS